MSSPVNRRRDTHLIQKSSQGAYACEQNHNTNRKTVAIGITNKLTVRQQWQNSGTDTLLFWFWRSVCRGEADIVRRGGAVEARRGGTDTLLFAVRCSRWDRHFVVRPDPSSMAFDGTDTFPRGNGGTDALSLCHCATAEERRRRSGII